MASQVRQRSLSIFMYGIFRLVLEVWVSGLLLASLPGSIVSILTATMKGIPHEHQRIDVNGHPIDHYVFRTIADYTYDWVSWHSPDGKLLWGNVAVGVFLG